MEKHKQNITNNYIYRVGERTDYGLNQTFYAINCYNVLC